MLLLHTCYTEQVKTLVDVVAKGGNLLLDVGRPSPPAPTRLPAHARARHTRTHARTHAHAPARAHTLLAVGTPVYIYGTRTTLIRAYLPVWLPRWWDE